MLLTMLVCALFVEVGLLAGVSIAQKILHTQDTIWLEISQVKDAIRIHRNALFEAERQLMALQDSADQATGATVDIGDVTTVDAFRDIEMPTKG